MLCDPQDFVLGARAGSRAHNQFAGHFQFADPTSVFLREAGNALCGASHNTSNWVRKEGRKAISCLAICTPKQVLISA